VNPDSISLVVVIFAAGVGTIVVIIGLAVVVGSRSEVGERITSYVSTTSAAPQAKDASSRGNRLSRFRYRLNLTLAILSSEEMEQKIASANWDITVTEYNLVRIFGALLFFLIGTLLLQNIFSGIGMAALFFAAPGFFLYRSVLRRQKQFQDQLLDSLTLIKGAIQAGYSFLQSLNVVVDEMAAPTSDEFRRARREVELGLPLNQALTNMANRMESDDLYLVVTAIIINMQVGGNLSMILDTVTETIRNRIYLLGEVRALTAYARYASYLLSALPFITVVALSVISPSYIEVLLAPGITRIILIYAVVSLILGNIWLRRLSKIDV
jgi:tight adherence protein B